MRLQRIVSTLLLALAAGAADADFKQTNLPARSFASVGDVALGTVVRETDDRLELDVAPCASTPVVIVFRKPYAKDVVQALHCGATAATQVQVVQK